MSDVIDWSNAPDWADKHGFTGAFKSAVWFDDKKYTYDDGQQDGKEFFYTDACTYAAKDFSQVSERPATASWSGEGLPPVGTACEVDGEKVVVVAHHCNGVHAIYAESLTDGLLCYGDPGEFRPIRTPEQIAADEREASVMQMLIECRSRSTGMDFVLTEESVSDLLLRTAYNIYDAGYRKQ
jgi:hypothetical protein